MVPCEFHPNLATGRIDLPEPCEICPTLVRHRFSVVFQGLAQSQPKAHRSGFCRQNRELGGVKGSITGTGGWRARRRRGNTGTGSSPVRWGDPGSHLARTARDQGKSEHHGHHYRWQPLTGERNSFLQGAGRGFLHTSSALIKRRCLVLTIPNQRL
jgi:hypothetical protein